MVAGHIYILRNTGSQGLGAMMLVASTVARNHERKVKTALVCSMAATDPIIVAS